MNKYKMNLEMNLALKFNLELIVACNKNGVIGDKNSIPWYVPEDLMNFKKITSGEIIIMGRKTFESLPNGPLKNRINIVITNRYLEYENDNKNTNLIFTDMNHIADILKEYQDQNQNQNQNKKIFIIGGAEIYELFFDYCSIIHLTIVHNEFNGDVFFPYDIDNFENKKLYENIYKSDLLFSKNKNIPYQYFTYKKNNI
jgi:dihydrofolate reductase